jgi:hypothetical protein
MIIPQPEAHPIETLVHLHCTQPRIETIAAYQRHPNIFPRIPKSSVPRRCHLNLLAIPLRHPQPTILLVAFPIRNGSKVCGSIWLRLEMVALPTRNTRFHGLPMRLAFHQRHPLDRGPQAATIVGA